MNESQIYTVMLSKPYPIAGREYPLHGFSYQVSRGISRDENEQIIKGVVSVIEIGHPTKIILWDKDGPELAELTEQMVKERIEEVLS